MTYCIFVNSDIAASAQDAFFKSTSGAPASGSECPNVILLYDLVRFEKLLQDKCDERVIHLSVGPFVEHRRSSTHCQWCKHYSQGGVQGTQALEQLRCTCLTCCAHLHEPICVRES